MNGAKQYILEHIKHLPSRAEHCVTREGAKHLKAIRKRRVGVKRLRTVERMLKQRGKLVPAKLFTARYRAAGELRSLGLMMRRIDTKRREQDELPIREALLSYTKNKRKKAHNVFETTRKIGVDTPETVFHSFGVRGKKATRVIERSRGSSVVAIATKYAHRQMMRINQECDESNRTHAYDRLHSIRKRVKHCMYIAQMLDDGKLRKRSATINGMLGERNDRSEFAEFVIKASKDYPLLLEYGTSLRTTCEQEADEIFTHLQDYVRM